MRLCKAKQDRTLQRRCQGWTERGGKATPVECVGSRARQARAHECPPSGSADPRNDQDEVGTPSRALPQGVTSKP